MNRHSATGGRLEKLRKELIHLVCQPLRVSRIQRKAVVALLAYHHSGIGISSRAGEAAVPHEAGVELLQLHLVGCAGISCRGQGIPRHSHQHRNSLR